jgi:hypothetical protein
VILYRTSGPWGAGIGANLSAAQVDGNFYDVSTRVRFLEQNPARPVQITTFAVQSGSLYIHMSDGSVQGPLPLPKISWNFRGNWTVSTAYAVSDVFVGPDSAVYIVKFAHTSSATNFDPNANDGMANNYYGLLLAVPAIVLPDGGAAGAALLKASSADHDFAWGVPAALPVGGATGQVLQKASGAPNDGFWNYLGLNDLQANVTLATPADWDYLRWNAATNRWINQPPPALRIQRVTSWSPVVGDDGMFTVIANSTLNVNIFIPNDSAQPFPVGTELSIHQDGIGTVSIWGDGGVDIFRHASFSNSLLGQYATATVKKTDDNEWRLFGLLAPASA